MNRVLPFTIVVLCFVLALPDAGGQDKGKMPIELATAKDYAALREPARDHGANRRRG